MYRFAAWTGLAALILSTPAVRSEEPAPALPDDFRLAQIRPSIPPTPDVVDEAMAVPAPELRRAVQPDLAARWAMAPKVVAKVDVSEQRMTVTVEGEVRHEWKVSTAGKGYRTPTGVWQPYRMHTLWHSRKYDNAPMPHSIFFTGGYAIHGTPHVKRLGRPASHGCVRLAPANAKALFALAQQYGRARMRVIVQP